MKLIDSLVGSFAKVFNMDGICIASGKIKDQKTTIDGSIDMNLITFDDKYFFNRKSMNMEIKFVENADYFIDLGYLERLQTSHWRDAILNYNKNIDIYVENTYDELDEEVKDLCYVLNKIPGIQTIGSCSGHEEFPLFVNIKFNTLDSLLFVLKILSTTVFREKFVLTNDKTILYTYNADRPILKLKTTCIGNNAYKYAKLLVQYIQDEMCL